MRKSLLICVCGFALAAPAALAPGTTLADTISLGLPTEAVQGETTQITYAVNTEGQGFVDLALNAAGGPTFAAVSLPIDIRQPQSEVPRAAAKPQSAGGAPGEARGCGTERLGRITATIKATRISCKRAHGVVHAVEDTPLPNDILETSYFTYSRSYSVSTPAGRFTCRREPFGLAGSEHNIRCKQGRIRVSWYTTHD
jgi:hypothetical protein